ncbi:hypothetical protein ACFE04_021496 [Oxalis oulophora]
MNVEDGKGKSRNVEGRKEESGKKEEKLRSSGDERLLTQKPLSRERIEHFSFVSSMMRTVSYEEKSNSCGRAAILGCVTGGGHSYGRKKKLEPLKNLANVSPERRSWVRIPAPASKIKWEYFDRRKRLDGRFHVRDEFFQFFVTFPLVPLNFFRITTLAHAVDGCGAEKGTLQNFTHSVPSIVILLGELFSKFAKLKRSTLGNYCEKLKKLPSCLIWTGPNKGYLIFRKFFKWQSKNLEASGQRKIFSGQ